MSIRSILVGLLALALPLTVLAQDGPVRLHAPEALVQTGLFDHILPRFSLKTQVRVELSDADNAQIVLGDEGRALFEGAGQTWKMAVPGAGHAGTDRLAEWLTSDVGTNTIQGYAPDGTALFGPPEAEVAKVAVLSYEGDAEEGHKVARAKCTRCHAVDDATAWSSIGSTPSFAVLRSLKDWNARFAAFYALKPHAAFTQIEDITDPFPENRPSPIAPIALTLDELEAIVAYVAAMDGADLGAPLEHQ